MRKFITLLTAIFIAAHPFSKCQAWSERGHHIISLMAFDLLTNEEQEKFLAILGNHPRYEDDFIPPKGLPNEEEIKRWKVGQAGFWPHVALEQPRYHRPTWHYELGATHVEGDASKLKIPSRPGPLNENATLETQELYISQAIELCIRTLRDKSSSPSDRAISLCWVSNLVADAHQPCNSGSLYAEGIFMEPDGDRQANRIFTKQCGNMHALWDQLLGDEFELNQIRKSVGAVTRKFDKHLEVIQGAGGADGLAPQTWLEESRLICWFYIYVEVLSSLRDGQGLSKENPIDVDEDYLGVIHSQAQSRAIQAAYRLAAIWKSTL